MCVEDEEDKWLVSLRGDVFPSDKSLRDSVEENWFNNPDTRLLMSWDINDLKADETMKLIWFPSVPTRKCRPQIGKHIKIMKAINISLLYRLLSLDISRAFPCFMSERESQGNVTVTSRPHHGVRNPRHLDWSFNMSSKLIQKKNIKVSNPWTFVGSSTVERWIPIGMLKHCGDVIMGAIASQITSLTIVYSTIYSDADQRKHQSSASLAFVWRIHRDRNAENVSIWWRHHENSMSWSHNRFWKMDALWHLWWRKFSTTCGISVLINHKK